MLRRDRNAKAGQLKSMRLDRIWPEHCLLCPKSRVSWYGYNSRAFRNQHVRFTPESGQPQNKTALRKAFLYFSTSKNPPA
jgi:hypothetical protein